MNPILYEETETTFKSNGLGRLSEAIRCKTHEVINGVNELAMTYPIKGALFSQLREGRIIYAYHDDTKNPQPYEIYRISRPLDGKITVNAAHISYKLRKIVAKPFTAEGVQTALSLLKSKSITTNPFEFTSDKDTVARMAVSVPTSVRELMGGVRGSIIDTYGGEWEFDHFKCTLRGRRGRDTILSIRYGKNLSDIERTSDSTDIWSGIVPYWAGSDENGDDASVFYDGVIWSAHREALGDDKVIAVDASQAFSEKPTVEQLEEWGTAYVNNHAKDAVPASVKINFVQLWQTVEYADVAPLQKLSIGDRLNVYYAALGVDDSARIVETTYDVLAERYDSMVLGQVRSNLASAIKGDIDDVSSEAKDAKRAVEQNKTFFEKAIETATELIAGGLGGYVIIKQNANGQPEEILIMNTDDKDTATQVMRFNKNGIGFGTSYNGPFNSAWTIDGTFDAQQINVINLNAASIVAGILQDAARKNYWNLTTGEFKMLNGLIELEGLVTIWGGGASTSKANAKVAVDAGQIRFQNEASGTMTDVGELHAGGNGQLILKANKLARIQADDESFEIGDFSYHPNSNVRTNFPHYLSTCGIDTSGATTKGIYLGSPILTTGALGAGAIHTKLLKHYLGTWLEYYAGATQRVTCYADFEVSSGHTKSKIEDTESFGTRALYSYETPSPMYGDVGFGTTDKDGVCYIALDPVFAETINKNTELAIFLQREGDGDLWIEEKTSDYFVVKGTPNLRFTWEAKGAQQKLSCVRLEQIGRDEGASAYEAEMETALSLSDSAYEDELKTEVILNEEFERIYGD